ncbi:MAG: hypothetical protein ACTSUE_19215 [Promethearchaeota archaeon]
MYGEKKGNKIIIPVFLSLLIISTGFGVFLWYKGPECDGQCYEISRSYTFGAGGYPRMAQVDDLLLVAYCNGSVVLDGINLTTGERVGPVNIISPPFDPARATLHYSAALDLVFCVYNHNQAAACGIAWVHPADVLNGSAWSRQDNVIGPVFQEFFHIGVWEPFIAPYNDTTLLLYVSNQTIFDPANPIDVNNYSFPLDGYEVVQKIDIFWIQWNGTGFDAIHCGVASENMEGGPIHFKDGMASSVKVWENQTHKEYLMTFEAFIPPDYQILVTMVKIRVSQAGVETLWRREITGGPDGAPFMTALDDIYVTSFRHWHFDGTNRIGFIGLKTDQNMYSQPIYLKQGIFGWPSIMGDSSNNLWLAGENETTGTVIIQQLNLHFNWRS